MSWSIQNLEGTNSGAVQWICMDDGGTGQDDLAWQARGDDTVRETTRWLTGQSSNFE